MRCLNMQEVWQGDLGDSQATFPLQRPSHRHGYCHRRSRAKRDFILAALFFFITPAFAVLSARAYTCARYAFASSIFFAATSFLYSFTARERSRFFSSLRVFRRAFCRLAFFADWVMGMGMANG